MQNNQNNQQGGQKPQQSLSWSQPAAGQQGQTKSSTPAAANAARPSTSNSSRTALVFVIGLLVGWLITWSWFDLRSGSNADLSSNATSTAQTGSSAITETQSGTSAGTLDGADGSTQTTTSSDASSTSQVSSDTVTVPSPQDAGTTVTVSNLSANDTVWAVVYEDNDGMPGRVLGAARFHSGETSGTIELLRSTLPNLTYYIGLVADTPDHTFSVHANAPLLGQNGKQIMAQFTAR